MCSIGRRTTWTGGWSAPTSPPPVPGAAKRIEALGRSRGGFRTKVHLLAEGSGKPLTFVLSGGERHEAAFFEPLLELGWGKLDVRGRSERRPERVVGDKGYSYDRIRDHLERRGVEAVIPLPPGAFTLPEVRCPGHRTLRGEGWRRPTTRGTDRCLHEQPEG